jgi:hypothetical protein
MMRKVLSVLLAGLLWLGAAGAALASDCSGTITTGGTAQTVFTSGNVSAVMLQNNGAAILCYSINGAAPTLAGTNCGSGSFALSAGAATVAGGLFVSPPNMKISVLSVITANTGDRFSCERQN